MPTWSHNARQVPVDVNQATAQQQKDQDRRLGTLERGAPLIIRGKISGGAGVIELGEGFTCTRTAKGNYKIELAFELQTVGVMVVSISQAAIGFVRVATMGKKVFTVEVTNPAQTEALDLNWTFMIVAS